MAYIVLKKVLIAVQTYDELNPSEKIEFMHITGLDRFLKDSVKED